MGDFGTAKDYRGAIAQVLEAGVSPRQSELLRAHLWAPRHSASSAELAEAVGYSGWRTVNFQYGTLARWEALGRRDTEVQYEFVNGWRARIAPGPAPPVGVEP